MRLGSVYLYKFVTFYFLASWRKFCNIIFLFLLKLGSVGHVDQQINLVSPNFGISF